MPSGIDTLSLVIEEKSIDDMERLLSDLTHACNTDSIEIVRNISLIAVVGLGMAGNKGTAAKLFGALANADVNIRMIDQGSSEMNIIVGVDNKHKDAAIEAIYRAFEI
jgi:aspartate kinase